MYLLLLCHINTQCKTFLLYIHIPVGDTNPWEGCVRKDGCSAKVCANPFLIWEQSKEAITEHFNNKKTKKDDVVFLDTIMAFRV